MKREKCAAIIVAAGTGSRAGGGVPKQFRVIAGKPLIAWSIETLTAHAGISTVAVVVASDQVEHCRSLIGEQVLLVPGGATRQQSVHAGLEALAPQKYDRVLVHDAARILRGSDVIDRLLAALDDHHAAIPILPVADTLTRGVAGAMADAVDRANLYRVQTPQAFTFETLLAAHRSWDSQTMEATDDAGMLRLTGTKVKLVAGDIMLEKVTHGYDFERMERVMAVTMTPHVGTGFDVHRTEAGRPLFLCGVPIEGSIGLAGHSDADVAVHALVDALLGALAEGDIGAHFPPSDPQWKGTTSMRFLEFARDRVKQRNGQIAHVDLTIICETPKIGPHRDRMRAALAKTLELAVDKVSVKATTTEGLGYTGRGEGIAAQASATILLPLF